MRSSLLALIRKDLKGYFDQPIGYLILVIFVGVASYLFFFVSQFNTTSEASVRELFALLPWLLAVFVPAATMRLVAEEQRDGTLEILLTQPIRGWIVPLAKFLSAFIFVGIAILATLGIPIALDRIGDIDWGAAAAQYIGALFLAASFVSIGLFTSSITRNQIVAFILGLFLIAVLMLWGLDEVAESLPDRVSGLLRNISPVTHFESISRGVINVRDVLYFVALVATFLSATFLMIRAKTLSHETPQYRNLQLGVAGLIVLSLLVGWFGSAIGGRMDLTEDKLFTLSASTRDIVSGLDDIMTVTLYQSKDPPINISLATRDVSDFLDDFAAGSDEVKIVRRYPDAEGNEKERKAAAEAQLAGIPGVPYNIRGQSEIGVKIGYLGLDITYADRRDRIPHVDSIDGFEYRLAALVNKMIQRERKTVAFLTGHGEKRLDAELQTLASLLAQQYRILEADASDGATLDLTGVDVLIIPGPTRQVPEAVQASLHGYLDRGGKAMVLIDSVLIDFGNLAAIPNQDSFAEFVTRYGVIVENDLVFDLRSHETLSFNTQGGSVLLPYPYWVRVPTVDEKVTGGVQSAVLPWASTVGISKSQVGRVEIITLLETTEFAAIDFNYGNVSPNTPVFNRVTQQNFVQSVLGVAVAAPANRTSSDGGPGSFRLVVLGDSDWLTEGVVGRAQENLALGLNLVDWLAQEDALADLRAKVVSSRTLLFDSSSDRNIVRYANIVGVPLAFVVIGLFRFIRRRRMIVRVPGREE